MRRIGPWLTIALLGLAGLPHSASAAGTEFPADGTIGLGRGGTGFLRADDPSVMIRNPALLADLWDNQVMLGAHFLIPDACFRATGAYGWNVVGDDVSNFGEGPVYLQAKPGSTDANGKPIEGYLDEPYPQSCYSGPMPFLPSLAISMKLADNLGIGIGFFAPETVSLSQWGNADGTIDTPQGLRPNPLRYYRSHLNVTFATLTGAVGYRIADWIRIGAGFQWSMAIFEARSWTVPSAGRTPRTDIRTDSFGRDLFIPALIASVHVVPHDNIDVAVGFKIQDRVQTRAKLDLNAGVWGHGDTYDIIEPDGTQTTLGSTIPEVTHNQPGSVESTPVWAPQLSVGVRYADRLKPRTRDWKASKEAAGETVEDHMATERWDVEFNFVYYFNSVFDRTAFINDGAVVDITNINADGSIGSFTANVGKCRETDEDTGNCIGGFESPTELGGKNAVSMRLGGDYNILPGKFSVRAGASYEGDGAARGFMNPQQYMFQRIGVHAGLTWRVASHTDFSFSYAHFFMDDIKLQVNSLSALPRKYKTEEYNFQPGLGEPDIQGEQADADNGHDDVAMVEVPYGTPDEPGPNFINGGSFSYGLDVVSINFTQHF